MRRRPALLLASVVALANGAFLAFPARAADPPAARVKVLVEFGWDEPDTAFLRRHITAMEQTPFDGCVFHALTHGPKGETDNLAWKFWGRRAFERDELDTARADLGQTSFTRFRHNFLRVNTTPADLDWFDDFAAVVSNARLAAVLARDGRCQGVLLDIEQYEHPLFDYHKQTHADTKSWDDYAAQARRRGRELMNAFQDGFPGLTVLSTFGPSLVHAQTRGGKTPARDASYGLLVPFLQGMSDATRPGARLVDGHELSYSYKEPARFDEALGVIRSEPPKLEAAFGLWLDHDWRHKGWSVDDLAKNSFTPEVFEKSVRAALERSDEIVWIYSETPRWWTEPDGRPAKMPGAYVDALRRARRGLAAD
jgi:hypothetical protein